MDSSVFECVQWLGCIVLQIFAYGNDAAAGGIEAVVDALKQHPSNIIVQQDGCSALWNLAPNSNDNQKAIAAAGGIEAVVAALTQYPDNVQQIGCNALWGFAANNDNHQKSIAAAGGIEAVVAALMEHRDNVSVQRVLSGPPLYDRIVYGIYCC